MNNPPKTKYVISILILASLFFVFGFVSWSNAILIPYFKIAFRLTSFKAYLVAFAFYISYLVVSLPASILLQKFGYKKSIVFGLWVMAFGAFIFVPAAMLKSYPVFLVALFTLGTGLSVLQTASNPYITIIGPLESAAQRISIMGICNKTAGIIAPLLLSFIILKSSDISLIESVNAADINARDLLMAGLLNKVILPYVAVGIVLFFLGFYIFFSPLPEIEHRFSEKSKKSVLAYPALVLGAVAIFFHVGTQIIAIDTIINYATSLGVSLNQAKLFPSYVLTLTITGYLFGIFLIPKVVSQLFTLKSFALLGLILSFLIVFTNGNVQILNIKIDISIWFIVMLGLANSLVWAGIWPLAIKDLGPLTKVGSSIMIMGLSGNAIMPLVYGFFADKFNQQTAYWVLVPCYIYIVYYAFVGHKYKSWRSENH